MPKKLTDEQLISAYKKGSEQAIEELVRRYLPLIYGFARRYSGDPETAGDIAQETFVKVWKNIRKFDLSGKFRPWLFTIARNTALDWLRKREDVPFSVFDDPITGESGLELVSPESPEISADINIRLKETKDELGRLPKNYRTIITLKDVEELTFREIAEALKEPLNTVKSRYRRAISALKTAVKRSLS